MIRIQVGIPEQTAQLLIKLQGLDDALTGSVEEALDQASAAILNRLRTTFRAEQDPTHTPWIPSKAGLKRKARGTGQTMFKTGRLFHSIQLYRNSDFEREIGSDVPYGPDLQTGHVFGGVPRPFIDLTEEHADLAVKIFVSRLKEALK